MIAEGNSKSLFISNLMAFSLATCGPCVLAGMGITLRVNHETGFVHRAYNIIFSFHFFSLSRRLHRREADMTDLLISLYPWTKTLHIVSVISWMAGMFYLPRLFVYHAEKATAGSELDVTFQEMERKLLRLIMTPAMIATWVFGLLLVLTPGSVDWSSGWAWIKAAGVLAMSGMHGWLGARRRDFAEGRNSRSGRTYRLANEVPTVLMLVVVVAVVVRPF